MPISVSCTNCGQTVRVADGKAGKRVKCSVCGDSVRIPDGDDAETEDLSTPRSRNRSGKRRKPQSSGEGPFKLVIGAAVAVVVLVTVGLVMRGGTNGGAPALPTPPDQTSTLAAISVSPNSSVVPTNETAPPSTNDSAGPVTNEPTASPDQTALDEAKRAAEAVRASDDFFTQGMIPELRIVVGEAEMATLKEGPRTFVIGSPRPYVQASILENGQTTYANVAIKLKGSAGSFRPVDDRPALTINVAKFDKQQTFHGMSKFHLNNSVQDDTYLHEWLCEDLFRAANLPATRVSHARVWLNDRDLGLYVLKSAFDKDFLKRHFKDAKGNLYEGGFVQDIDVELEKEEGKGPDDRSDLTALLNACREPDIDLRWQKVDSLLNVDHFISFMAMEMMVDHWDGYTLKHNNYRLYFDSNTQKAHFIPHGMDQVFNNANASVIDLPSSIVGSSVMLNGDWRERYRKRLAELLTLFSPTDNILRRVDVAHQRLQAVLNKMNPQSARDHDDRVRRLKERLVARVENLIKQQSQSDPQPNTFDENGRLKLTDWVAVSESPDAKLETVDIPKGPKAYSILCGKKGMCNASWRCKALLGKGTYILHANMKTKSVSATDEKNRAVGAGIRVSGQERSNARKGTTANWTPVEFEFTVGETMRKVEFIAELRAKGGQVWFEVESLYLTQKPSQ